MRVAVICFENPYVKPMDGAKNDIRTRLVSLSQIKECEVDVYAFNKYDEKEVSQDSVGSEIHSLYQYNVCRISYKALLSKQPLSVYKRMSKECIEELKSHEYDAIIYEGEHMSSYRIMNHTIASKHILRQHDIESNYRYELSKSSPSIFYKIGQLIESVKYKILEKDIDKYFDSVLFISCEEKKYFDSKYEKSRSKFVFMPTSTVRFTDHIPSRTLPDTILYIGNLELNNNVLSIIWFASKVYPLILKYRKNAVLKVIGKCAENNRRRIEAINSSIKVLGYVEDLDQEINSATLLALPVLYGAGVKVKVIDALSHGQIVCATSKAIEGTLLKPGEHLIVEDKPERLAMECVDIMKKRDDYRHLAENGLEYVKKYHSIQYQKRVLESVLGVNN